MITIPLKNAYILKNLYDSLTDSGTLSCFEGLMGTAYADNELNPQCCGIHLGEYMYIGGNSESTDFLKELFPVLLRVVAEDSRLSAICCFSA